MTKTRDEVALEDRFYSKTKPAANGCIEWVGARMQSGYGVFYLKRSTVAHRVAWTIANGAIPEGMYVLHKCDNPPCVNIDHLFIGTLADNNHDKIAKGRAVYVRGESHGMYKNRDAAAKGVDAPAAKLNPDKVCEIIGFLNDGVSQGKLAKKYGVCRKSIANIKNAKTWMEVTSRLPNFLLLNGGSNG